MRHYRVNVAVQLTVKADDAEGAIAAAQAILKAPLALDDDNDATIDAVEPLAPMGTQE